jgi:hypothetical protein
MALSDLWRNLRGEHRDRRDYESRPNYVKDESGFDRRGWRSGSDYYGNDDRRFFSQGGDFEGEQHYRGSDDDWRTRSGGDYGDRRGEGSFNDRWQNAYGPGIPSTSLDYTGRSVSDPGYYASQDRDDARWWNDRAGWPGRDATSASQSFRGRGPQGYRRSDERIREDACECLMEDDYVDASEIEVEVRDGEVTLSGTVESRDQKRRAESLLEQLSGVSDVHNRLRVTSSESHRPQPSM